MPKAMVFNYRGDLIKIAESQEEIEAADADGYKIINCDYTEVDDPLQTILDIQRIFQGRLGTDLGGTLFITQHAQYANAELHEMFRELEGFKAWKTYNWSEEEKAKHDAAAKEEFIDALHFIFNIALALGLTSEDIFDIYVRKNIVNHVRQDNGY